MTEMNQGAAIPAEAAATPQMGYSTPGVAWSEDVRGWILDGTRCPVCFATPLIGGYCATCAADLRGPAGEKLAEASGLVADALRVRQSALAAVPRVVVAQEAVRYQPSVQPQSAAVHPAPAYPTPVAQPAPTPTPATSSASLQSVLAVSGAGLFAIAAIVFTFFNPDLSDKGLRSAIVGLTTLAFAGGAWLLARRSLQFSAEAVGGLAMVFVGLDIWAVARWSPDGINPWLLAALATLVAAGCLAAAGKFLGVKVWSFGAAVAVTLVPAMIGISSELWFAFPLGFVAMAFVGFAVAGRIPSSAPQAALGTLTALQIIAGGSAFYWAFLRVADGGSLAEELVACGIVATLALHAALAARHQIPRLWSVALGILAATSAGLTTSTLFGAMVKSLAGEQNGVLASTASTISVAIITVLAVITVRVRFPKHVSRFAVLLGLLSALATLLLTPVLSIALGIAEAILTPPLLWTTGQLGMGAADELSPVNSWPFVWSLAIVAVGAFYLCGLLRRRWSNKAALAHFFGVMGVSFSAFTLLSIVAMPFEWAPWRLAIPLVAAAAWALGVRWMPKLQAKLSPETVSFRVAAHVLIAVVAIISWREPLVATITGVGVLLALTVVAQVTSSNRSWHVGIGYAYGLVIVAAALGQLNDLPAVELNGALQLSIVTSIGLLGALGATVFRVCEPRSWRAILLVTLLPFGLGIAQVAVERSGWTAISTGLMCALAFVLMITRRPGLGVAVRAIAAGMLVPSLSVFVVCLGAVTIPGSASPITLPIIAVIVGAALLLAMPTRGMLERHGLTASVARVASLAIEVSALVTGAIAVLLALVRQAAGLGTTLTVLLVLGTAAATAAKLAGRRYAWWVAGASFTGALWCVWGLANVTLFEAYLLPPTLGAAVVAAVLTARGKRASSLYACWMGLAIAPVLMLFAVDGSVGRGFGLLAGSLLLLALGAWFGRMGHRTETRPEIAKLSTPTLLASMLAAVAGPALGVRFGTGLDTLDVYGDALHGPALFLLCLTVAVTGALVMAIASGRMPVRNRWLGAPALLALAIGVWPSIERDWFNIWAMWGMMCIGIAAVIVAAIPVAIKEPGSQSGRSLLTRIAASLPPVWFVFAVTFVTAIVAWSPRDLRVEWFSLPLGIGLLVAGSLGAGSFAARSLAAAKGSETGVADSVQHGGKLAAWPSGWSGSWAHYGPGLIVMISASVLATFTDPQTWRAILVIVIALIAIVVGAALRLAAPFLLGIIVLPIENVIAFAVQIGRGIESMPWWITLAIVGAVLLTIAVTYERRAGEAETLVARLRDLR